MKNTIKFDLVPTVRDISMAGDKGRSFLKSHGFSDDEVQGPVMILSELIKNSIKYGRFAPTANEIGVRLQIDRNTYTIEVLNPVDETCNDRLRELDKTIQFIRGYQDPHEAYSKRLAETTFPSLKAQANDPCLIKTAYEGGVILDFFVSEDNFLNLSAVGSLDGNGGN